MTITAKDSISLIEADIFSSVRAGAIGKGGDVSINAANLTLRDGAQISTSMLRASDTQSAGKGSAGNVNIEVAGVVDIAGIKNEFESAIFSSVGTGTEGNGGNITIDASSLNLQDGAKLSASTYGKGSAGNVTVTVKDSISLDSANIFSTVEAGGVGKGGNIDINATTLSLINGAQLLTTTRSAENNQPAGRGSAGNVNVKVAGVVNIAGMKGKSSSGIRSNVGIGTEGNGGNITIDAGSFTLSDNARINASTSGVGNAGNITVAAKNTVFLADAYIFSTIEAGGIGKGGDININATSVLLNDGAELIASTYGQGNAGNIIIKATDALTLSGINQNRGFSTGLYTDTVSTATGTGGDITVNTNMFRIANGAAIDAGTTNNQKGGDITINANMIEAIGGGLISTTTSSDGNAGKVTVNAADQIIIDGFDSNYNNRVAKFSLEVVENISANSGIFVSSIGSGTTGDIEINSPKITLDNQGKLQAEGTSGNGGNINLNSDLLLLRRGSQISTNAGTEQQGGDGGNININSSFIIAVPKENSDITANAFTGKGGNVNIRSQGIFGIAPRNIESPETSDITASSAQGVQGQVSIAQPATQPTQGIIELPTQLVDASSQIGQTCPKGTYAKRSLGNFTVTGRGSLPPNPLEPLTGANIATSLATLDGQNNNTSNKYTIPENNQNQILEAQGWVKGGDGNVSLITYNPTLNTPVGKQGTQLCVNS